MYNQVDNYFTEKNFLFPKQFAFQINTSAKHEILELLQNITKSFKKNEFVLGVFIGLKRAFDTVNHEILLHKLRLYIYNKQYIFKMVQKLSFKLKSMHRL